MIFLLFDNHLHHMKLKHYDGSVTKNFQQNILENIHYSRFDHSNNGTNLPVGQKQAKKTTNTMQKPILIHIHANRSYKIQYT
ncbi:MAG: hypothetical protein BHV68_12430 [Bacteroidales bacterium 43_8]|nr:MAG: hypothetical protein BHV68_12430 [Bacteroidales bacterium 43_8]